MMLYARVFTSILDSSLAEDWKARHVFEDLLKLADGGVVDITKEALARRTNIPLQEVERAIAILEQPDADSRDAAEDGRRIVRLDDHRDWGWRIVNWQKYEDIKSTLDQRAKTAERVRRHREKKAVSPALLPKEPASASASASEAEDTLPKRNGPLPSVTVQTSRRQWAAKAAQTTKVTESQWLADLGTDPAYQGIDVNREHAKMLRWCAENKQQPTRRRFISWLNRIDKPLTTTTNRSAAIIPLHTITGPIDPNEL